MEDADFLEQPQTVPSNAALRPECVYLYGCDTLSTSDCMGAPPAASCHAFELAVHCAVPFPAFSSNRGIFGAGYFREWCPVFVEWINDSSCNVVFADAFTAQRAMNGKAR